MVIILDFGSQYTQLIFRYIRNSGVNVRIFPYNVSFDDIPMKNVRSIVLSGSPDSVMSQSQYAMCDKRFFLASIPMLGICYGMQVMIKFFHGKISLSQDTSEYGHSKINIVRKSNLFNAIPDNIHVWMSHKDSVKEVPSSFSIIAENEDKVIVAIEDKDKKIYAVQFHPEVSHTQYGSKIISNFLEICGIQTKSYDISSVIDKKICEIKSTIQDASAICAFSGGVDSLVAATLVSHAIGDRLYCFFIDTGLLSYQEKNRVLTNFSSCFKNPIRIVDAENDFLKSLQNISDPEEKRKIIGLKFVSIFQEQARQIPHIKFLVQGTIYPDVIESSSESDPSSKIKTHHNLYLPKDMHLRVVEPLSSFFKDEVRQIGFHLGFSKKILYRYPFPGPGLAIRIMGSVTRSKVSILQQTDKILHEELLKQGLYDSVWQAFTILLTDKSVGVMGDRRTYEYVCVIRAVTSENVMTAKHAYIPHHVLEVIANKMINHVNGINRVVLDITSKPPGTIEWE